MSGPDIQLRDNKLERWDGRHGGRLIGYVERVGRTYCLHCDGSRDSSWTPAELRVILRIIDSLNRRHKESK